VWALGLAPGLSNRVDESGVDEDRQYDDDSSELCETKFSSHLKFFIHEKPTSTRDFSDIWSQQYFSNPLHANRQYREAH
jgi:pyoverdine/dityrosine biosynthesis protein Dit1